MIFSSKMKLALVAVLLLADCAWTQDWDQDPSDQTIVGGTAHECFRECNGTRMECHFEFTVRKKTTMSEECGKCPLVASDCYKPGCIVGGGIPRTAIAVNGKIPGPSIYVCEGDLVQVHVINRLRTEAVTIHWHGVHQKTSPFSDGVPYVNQMPIVALSDFKYSWHAHPHGTHMWHGHNGFQEAEGLFGTVVIRRNESAEIAALYDTDDPNHTVIIWHWYPTLSEDVLVSTLQKHGSVFGYGFLINGKANFNKTLPYELEVFNVTAGQRHRFRFIYNSAIYCPLHISVDDHELTMISSDAEYFEPVTVDSFMMEAGERYDLVLHALENGTGCYWMRIRALGDCDKTKSSVYEQAYVCYDGAIPQNRTMPAVSFELAERKGKLLNPVQTATYNYSGYDLVQLHELNSTDMGNNSLIYGEPTKTLYIQVHSRPFTEVAYPGPWHQLNNVSFEFPGPEFMKYLATGVEEGLQLCDENSKEKYCGRGDYCKCALTERIETGDLVEMILVDISWNRDQDHPMHLHGFTFFIVGSGLLEPNETLDDIKRKNERGELTRSNSFLNGQSVAKDSTGIPNRGWMAIRFHANNTGLWMFHCHVTNHVEMGMAMLLQVGTRREIVDHCENFNTQQCDNWYTSYSSVSPMTPQRLLTSIAFAISLIINRRF